MIREAAQTESRCSATPERTRETEERRPSKRERSAQRFQTPWECPTEYPNDELRFLPSCRAQHPDRRFSASRARPAECHTASRTGSESAPERTAFRARSAAPFHWSGSSLLARTGHETR